MAKLVDRTALGTVRLPAASGDVRAGSPNYGLSAAGDEAMASGLRSVAAGGQALVKAGADYLIDANKEAEYDTNKRLLDFKLQTEMELEEHKRTMAPGGSGYTSSWQERYRERAQEFVGEKDGNVPKHLRGRVGMLLKQHEVTLQERAQRDEMAEQDRSRIEGLEQTLGVTRSRVEADPARLDEMRAEGAGLIEGVQISPAAKDRLRKHYNKELDKTAIISRIMKAQTAEEFKALEMDLAPHRPDKRTPIGAPSFAGQGGPAAVRYNNPGAMWPGPSSAKFGAVDSVTLNDGQGNKIAVFPDAVSGAAAHFDLLSRSYTGKTLASAITTWSGNNSSAAYAEKVARETGLSPSTVLTKEMMRDPAIAVPLAKAMSSHEAGKGSYPLSDEQWTAAHQWASTGQKPQIDAVAPDADSYAGPYQTMTLADRKAFVSQVDNQRRKLSGEVEKVIKDQMAVAADGYAPPAPMMAEIEKRVQAIGDPMLAAQYQTLMGKVGLTQDLQKAPPAAIEEMARRERELASTKGATKQQVEMVEHIEKIAGAVKKQVNENPLGHAQKVGLDIPLAEGPPADADPSTPWKMPTQRVALEKLNFADPDIDGMLARRMETAKGVGRYYGQNPQAFTPIERDFLKDQLAKGGPVMLGIMGKIAKAAGDAGIDPEQVMKEFSKDAPEVGIVGELVANNADPRVLDTASKALAWKVGMGEKFSSSIDPALASAALGPMAEVLKSQPTKVDSIKALAAVVYEYEARTKGIGAEGKVKFSPSDYQSVVNRIMGETKDANGVTYGGIGEQGSGWFDGKSGTKVLVPAGVRSDSFDALLTTIRNEDVPKLGLPQTGDGRPLTAAEIRRANWVSTGRGRYVLVLGEDADGTKRVASNSTGQPLEIDVRPLLPALQKRRPDIFMGYNPMLDVIPPAPPAETGTLYQREPGMPTPEPTPPGQRRGTTGAMSRSMREVN